jgi:hypothetical protein
MTDTDKTITGEQWKRIALWGEDAETVLAESD